MPDNRFSVITGLVPDEMANNKKPTPTNSVDYQFLLKTKSLNKELAFLDELMSAHAEGDVDRAAACAAKAIFLIERPMVDAMVGTVNNLAHAKNHYPPSVRDLLCKATDLGFLTYAYNAANHIMNSATSAGDYTEAARYFKIAMDYTGNAALQAAAHVNYCPIVRDGLISGEPDWPSAVEIYEKAARMGLVKAMFNAGNVCSWLADKGDRAYAARAASWFTYALDHRAAQKQTLDMESPAELETVFDDCIQGLSGLHIDSRFDGASLETGISLAKNLAERGNQQARHNLGVGYIRRLAGLKVKPQQIPGANWRAVLSAMDWQFSGKLRTFTLDIAAKAKEPLTTMVDELTVVVSEGEVIPLIVTHDLGLPAFGGFNTLEAVAVALLKIHPDGFLLLSSKAIFIEQDERTYTPILVWTNGKFSRQTLWMSGSPSIVLQHARDGVDFLDKRFSSWTCMISIAVNALDEGFVVAKNTVFNQPWVDVGSPWKMPFVKKENMTKLGFDMSDAP